MKQAEIIGHLHRLEPAYTVRPDVGEPLHDVVGVPLVGPVGIGKTTLMRAATALDPAFGRLQGFTTREIRPGEAQDTYHWLNHNEETLGNILRAVRERTLAQYAMHPTGRVYGSWVEAYAYPFTMIDALAKAVAPLKRMPLQDVRPFYLVAPPEVWRPRAEERNAYTSLGDMQKRLKEGADSLEWGLEQDGTIQWIDNSRPVREVAAELVACAQEPSVDRAARRTGELLLQEIKSML